VFLGWFFLHIRATERAGKDPLLSPRLFRNRTSNLGLVTQNVQWLTMQGTFFVVSVFLQQIRGYNAIQTGLMLTPSTIGVLLSSAAAGRLARKRSQEVLIRAGFVATALGIALMMALVREQSGIWTFVPGLLLIGLGIGVMLTSSVNVVQSAFPERDQGDISGLSRSVSNLGSSLGTALAGSVLVGASVPGGKPFALALTTMGVIVLLGLLAAVFIPTRPPASTAEAEAEHSAP
jgi:predicted MFS family arabinose efflux permease